MRIVLIGMMGSGKSTVGRLIARKLKLKFHDSDQLIAEEQKMTIPEIFERQGEPAFRALETKMIAKLSQEPDCVIATGGGAPTIEENWKSFEKGAVVVWLKVKPETLYERLKDGGSKARPLLKDSLSLERISRILKERETHYRRANLTVETDDLEPEESAEKILRLAAPKSS